MRIVEQSDDSKSTSKSPQSARDSGSKLRPKDQNSSSGSMSNTFSSSAGHETLDSGSYFPEEPSYMPEIPGFMDGFVGTEAWGMGDPNTPTYIFDSLMDMGPNGWGTNTQTE